MKRWLLILTLLAATGVSLFAQLLGGYKFVATINLNKAEFITVQEFEEKVGLLETAAKRALTDSEKRQLLDSMVNEKLFGQAFEDARIRISDQEMQQQLAVTKQSLESQIGQSLSDEAFRNYLTQQSGAANWNEVYEQLSYQLKVQKYVMQESKVIKALKDPENFEVEKQYRTSAVEFVNPEFIRMSQIYIDTKNLSSTDKRKARERADQIFRDLQNGRSSFEDLAKQYSDDQASRYNGGDTGYFAINDPRFTALYGTDFYDQVFGFRSGAVEIGVVDKVLESNIGYHIVKITEHTSKRFLSLSDPVLPTDSKTVRESIVEALKQQALSEATPAALQEVQADLTKRAEITIFEENIQ